MPIHAITIDLDDTLWPIWPAIERAETALHEWLMAHCPEVAARYDAQAMRALRDAVMQEHPDLGHDFTSLRKISLRRAMQPDGYDEVYVDKAFEVFFDQRNQVTLYADVRPVLEQLAQRVPLVSLSNGNADLKRIGIAEYFRGAISARGFGKAKPDAGIFHAACDIAGVAPQHTLHVGDHPEQDIVGALNAGMKTAWINRHDASWHLEDHAPHFSLSDLSGLLTIIG
jgi:FMN hydrolase / 5-amino-6-(5-phospho-D-ribitylamino)uracil phosphatase